MSKLKSAKSEYDFLLYRIEALEKRFDAQEKRLEEKSELVHILLGLLEKKTTTTTTTPPVAEQPQEDTTYDALLSFARRRTLI